MSGSEQAVCRPLYSGFLDSVNACDSRAALDFGDHAVTYGELGEIALRIAGTIEGGGADATDSPWIGMLVNKSIQGYAAILGILLSGRGYVPLSCSTPISRLAEMITRSGTRVLIVDDDGARLLPALLKRIDRKLTVCVAAGNADNARIEALESEFTSHTFLPVSEVPKNIDSVERMVKRDTPAYLLFTSGSTGRPKGVMVSHGNVQHFLHAVANQYSLSSADRFSQNFDFTFDLSVFDIFVTLEVGGCICVPSEGDKVLPRRYISRSRLTVWFSVPSAVTKMQDTRQLSPGAFSGLRYSLFCGEALIVKVARLWHEAAPNAALINLYGPTEATVYCTAHTWDARTRALGDEQIVPIGSALPGLYTRILGERMRRVADAEVGELWIGGPQVALGYLDSPSENAYRFLLDDQTGERLYRTGDRVFSRSDADCLHFVGRVDHQLKINGYRVELGEVEQALRACSASANVVAAPWPPEGPYEKLIAVFDAGVKDALDDARLLRELKDRLPAYMLPAEIVYLHPLPLNGNGKIDRLAVGRRLVELQSHPTI
jgi:amino acid adenylation domain-containing protein